MSTFNQKQAVNQVAAYTSLELLQLNEKDLGKKVIKKIMLTNQFKTAPDVAMFVNQYMVNDVVSISQNPNLTGVIGGMPWTLFYWGYMAVEGVQA